MKNFMRLGLAALAAIGLYGSAVAGPVIPGCSGACAFTNVTLTPAADTTAITETGYSVTGSGTTKLVNMTGTWNTSGAPTAWFLNITNTASSASSLLMDLQYSGTTAFKVRIDGVVTTGSTFISGASVQLASTGALTWATRSELKSSANGLITLLDAAETDFGRLMFGGTTSSYPALKRSTTLLEFRLADDSAYTKFRALSGFLSAPTADTAATDTTLCRDTTSGEILTGTGALGTCLGTSSARFKQDIKAMGDGLAQVLALKPVTFQYRAGYGPQGKEMYGLIAEDVIKTLPKLVGLDKQGRANSVDMVGMIPVLINALKAEDAKVQKLQAANDNLVQRVEALERKLATK